MEKLTHIEVKWLCGLLDRSAKELYAQADEAEATIDLAPQMFRLKAEQYTSISARLRNAVEKKSKRVEITY